MRIALVYEFPPFDTGLFEGARFLMAGGNAELLVRVAGHDDIVLNFACIRWHQFTALYNCTAEQVQTAYFKLVDLAQSHLLTKYIAEDRANAKAYKELHHFRVFLDGHGCHEVFAESASGSQRSPTDA